MITSRDGGIDRYKLISHDPWLASDRTSARFLEGRGRDRREMEDEGGTSERQ